MSRIAWMVIVLVGWTLLCAAFSLVLPQPTVLCPAALPLDPLDPIAVCQRQLATQDTSAMAVADIALLALWAAGAIVAVVLGRNQIRRSAGVG